MVEPFVRADSFSALPCRPHTLIMVEAVFARSFASGLDSLLDSESQIALTQPESVDVAHELEHVLPLLKNAEAKAKRGYWVAVILSYEAAPAFDPDLRVHDPDDFPLAWSASFTQPSLVIRQNNYQLPNHRWVPGLELQEYEKAISCVQELIARGDTYQVNYTFPLTSSFRGSERGWFDQLCLAQSEAYAAYIDLGRFKLLSLSPELFFERQSIRIITRPMKGTIKRGRWSEEDLEFASQLANSVKDRAENVMIVDLLRNDLGKVAVTGSVSVPKLFQVEQYETLWQMTSTVESTMKPGVDLPELMSAIFPCGSVTGAPKIRTMEIITELEPFPRRAYTGAIGLIRPGGDCVFSVAIRTLIVDSSRGQTTLGVGSGITIDSVAAQEYDECLLKAAFLQYSPSQFDLLETMLIEEGEVFLLARHLERLVKSARYFGFVLNNGELERVFETLREQHPDGAWRVRLLVSKDGTLKTEVRRLENTAERTLQVKLALEPVDSSDLFLFHKTTKRTIYDQALAAFNDCDDVVLWNERGEITESTKANVVLRLEGELVTPPQSSGLLAGTFRAELLASGKIRECVINKEELLRAKSFFLINSVSKWNSAILVQ